MRNRLRLNGTEQDITITFSDIDIVSTSAKEIVRVKANTTNVTKNISDEDQFFIEDDIENYEISSSGGNIVRLEKNDKVIEISIGSGISQLGFKGGMANIEIDQGQPKFAGNPVTTIPFDPTGISFTPIPDHRIEVIKNTSDMKSENTSEQNPFRADDDDKRFIFEIDANQLNHFYIKNFSSKDKIRFINSPTGQDGDLNVSNNSYIDGKVRLTVGDADVDLSGLLCAAIWDADSFRTLIGQNTIEIL